MGATNWSAEEYATRATTRAATSTPTFEYHAKVTSGKAPKMAHGSLDPLSMKGGIRECRDSAAHPASTGVAICLDVTGSMLEVPKTIQKRLCQLMSLLLQRSWLTDPSILIAAVGDLYSDSAPFQVGQFESGIEIENDLTNLFLEGGGGGSCQESYELMLYFLAHHTAMDCFEKRSRKGYAFIIGDEMAYDKLPAEQVKKVFGSNAKLTQDAATLDELLAAAQRKFDVYYIQPKMTYHWREDRVVNFWKGRLGQNLLFLEDPEAVSEMIATTIAINEGIIEHGEIEDALVSTGLTTTGAGAVSSALAKYEPAAGVPTLVGAEGTDLIGL